MKVALTGASGFLGSNFKIRAKEFDIRDIDLLNNRLSDFSFSGVDCILHLAALVHQMKGAPAEEYFKINTQLAYETASKAKKEGVSHFVYLSSIKVYGEITHTEPFNENTKCSPIDPYGKSKLAGEKCLESLTDSSFRLSIVRSPLIYGPGVRANMLSLIRLVDKLPLLPIGGMTNKRAMVYIGNIVSLLKIIITRSMGGVFIANDNVNISTSELVLIIARLLNKKRLLVTPPKFVREMLHTIQSDIYNRLFSPLELDNKITRDTLKFAPPFSVEEGMTDMIQWYINNK